MLKRIFALTLAMLMLAAFLGCDLERIDTAETSATTQISTTESTTATAEATTEKPSEPSVPTEITDKLVILFGGETKYSIVYPSRENDQNLVVRNAAKALKDAFISKLGVTPGYVSETTAATDCEIVIGKTSRLASTPSLAKNEYLIKASGKKIYISAGSDEILASAVQHFIDNYLIKDTDGACLLPLDLRYKGSVEIIDTSITLKTATYNIKNGEIANYNYNLIAQDILSSGAEIVALQEVDKNSNRNGYKDTMAILSQKTGYAHYYFAKAVNLNKGGEYGVAILSKYPIVSTTVIDLPELESGDENRVCLHAKININGFILDYFVTHTNQSCVDASLLEINKTTSTCSPFILAGDFNTASFDKFQVILNSKTVNNSTTNLVTTTGGHKFDNFVISNKISVNKYQVINTGHSDHHMLYCEFTIPTK